MTTSALILGRRHFRVEFTDFATGVLLATLWVPTSEGTSESLFLEAEKFARLHGCEVDVAVAGERLGVRCLPA